MDNKGKWFNIVPGLQQTNTKYQLLLMILIITKASSPLNPVQIPSNVLSHIKVISPLPIPTLSSKFLMINSKSLAYPPDLQSSSLISSFVFLAILLPHHPFFLPQRTKLLSTSGPLNILCLQSALLLLLSWLTPHLLGLS